MKGLTVGKVGEKQKIIIRRKKNKIDDHENSNKA